MTPGTSLQNNSDIDTSTSDLRHMVNERGKTCVSIIVPTHRSGQDRQADRLETERAINAAKRSLSSASSDYFLALDDLFGRIDFTRNKEGVGIFVSPHIKKLVKFPFPVIKKIVVNQFFHLHDLIYVENYKSTYYLLDISKKEVHLFRGTIDHLEEIVDQNFPKKLVEEYEYQRPSPSASGRGSAHVKDIEKDKSILKQMRMKIVFHKIDKALSKYVARDNVPLLLCGPQKDVSIYKSTTGHLENIVTSISDNYKNVTDHDLGLLAWISIRKFIDDQKLKLVDDFKEKFGTRLGVCGVQDVWTASKEGRGLILLVEKDYGRGAYVTKDNKLHWQHPKEKFARYPDIVNEIITTVLEKGGKVVVVEKDSLEEYKRIALITRY